MTDHETTAAPTLPDLRWALTGAQHWVGSLLANVRREQWDDATPCTEFDVEDLIKHLYGVMDRVVVMGGGGAATSVPAFAAELPDDVAGGFRHRIDQAEVAWADDASLARPVTAPWGTMPGAFIVPAYTAELVAHGWDLAVATGQDSETDPAVAEVGLAAMRQALPAEGREEYPFGPVVISADDAGPTERLANWVGRAR